MSLRLIAINASGKRASPCTRWLQLVPEGVKVAANGNAYAFRHCEAEVMSLRALIIDDSADFIDAARGLLECQGVTVVGVASTSAEALRRFEELRPDVTLVDVDLGGESGFDVVEQLHASGSPAPVILISTHAVADLADMVADSPAVGFISKSDLTCRAILDLVGGSAGLEDSDRR
jgi:CheY-like chemotaxis protein